MGNIGRLATYSIRMRPFLKIDELTSLHLPRPELAGPVFGAIDENRAFLRNWLPWVDGTRSVEDTKTFISESMEHNRNGTRLTTFISYDGKMAGALGVINFVREHRKCEVGYWLREDLQGMGVMSKSLTKFVGYLFKSKGINRVEAQVLAGNGRSSAVLLRAGFKKEAMLRQSVFMYNQFFDVAVFGLVKEDWSAGKIF